MEQSPQSRRVDERKFSAIREGLSDLEDERVEAVALKIVRKIITNYKIDSKDLDEFFSLSPNSETIKNLLSELIHYGANIYHIENVLKKCPALDEEIFQKMLFAEATKKLALENLHLFSLTTKSTNEFKMLKRECWELPQTVNDFFAENSNIFEKTAIPALRFHAYNYLANNPKAGRDDLKAELKRFQKISDQEKKYKSIVHLPTIGIEIELPTATLTSEKVFVLEKLGIPNYEEEHPGLWEVNPDFSYGPASQARVLQELARFGAVPLEPDENSKIGKIPSEESLSMHINFAPKDNSDYRQIDFEGVDLVSGLLTYGFASPERLLNRKTSTAHEIKSDPQGDRANLFMPNFRLELRAGEFKNFPTFRLLTEAQRLVALVFSEKRYYTGDEKINRQDKKQLELKKIFSFLKDEIKEVMGQFNVVPKQMDETRGEVQVLVEVLRTTDLQKRCRSIITKYSKEVAKILDLADSVDEEKEAQESVLEM
jgi:hypothetical protein